MHYGKLGRTLIPLHIPHVSPACCMLEFPFKKLAPIT